MSENGRAADSMPQTIGRYQVAESVGFGAMGAVYKAFDPLIKRTLAIKTIRLDIPRQSPQYKSFIERFYHEARISGTLSHPNIVTLFDIGEESGLPYLAMEFVDGETISAILEKGTRFKPEKVIGLVSQVASAIDYAHSKGVIHRDIKPSNLILAEGERVKVTDFGIAKLIDAEMTQSGTLLGTPSYMSPEQAMGDKLDGRSDIFSLGVCAFEMLAGEQPFPGNNVTSILYKLVHVEPIQPANLEMNGLVPQKWHEVFGKVLAKKPDDRYQTATEFVQDLEYCLGSWFGAVGEMTMSEAAPVAVPAEQGSNEETTLISTLPDEVTMAMPPSVAARQAAAASPQTLVEALPVVAAPQLEGTVVMQAPFALPASDGTVVMAAPVEPPLPEPVLTTEGTVVMSAPVLAQPESEGTVVMMAPVVPPPPPAPAPEMEGTVVMKAPPVPPVQEGTVVMHAPVAAAAPESEGTVVMAAPALPKLPPPVAPRAPAMEGTVVMAAPAPASRPGEMRPGLAPFADDPTSPPPPTSRPPAGKSGPLTIPIPPKPTATAAMPPIDAPRKRSMAPLALLGGGVGLLAMMVVAGAVVWYLKFRKPAEETVVPPPPPSSTLAAATPTPPPAATVVKGSLHVESDPAGATVTLNGEAKGVTPLDVGGLFLGNQDVKIELKGYAAVAQTVVLSEDAPTSELKITLERAAPAMSTAEIVSTPAGALVKVDGAGAGQTPLDGLSLKVGKHEVEIVKDGFEPWTGTLVVGRRKARIEAHLRSLARSTPTPEPQPEAVDPNRTYDQADVDTPPRQTSGTSASYPKDAPKLKSGQSVSVGGTFVVNVNGEVTEIQVRESGGRQLDDAVMAALAKRKYTAGAKKGVKVKVRVPFRQTFQAS
jgi:serine/threonine-protein kinase